LAGKSAFGGIRSTVQDGIVTLSGTVDQYKYKLDAAKKARKQKNVQGVRNLVEVGGQAVSDLQLRDQIARKLAYDRIGNSNLFNVFTVGVQNGVVTVGGEVRDPYDKQSALAEVAATKGVKDVLDQVKVAPTSIYDDELRVRVARAVYGDSALFRYGMDPAAPIRIVVDNGHVALYGAVDSPMDRTIAGLRAGQVFGAFSVENHLQTPQDVSR
jgi:hyperosmotically inducible protein